MTICFLVKVKAVQRQEQERVVESRSQSVQRCSDGPKGRERLSLREACG